jgi:hypothetical protein
MNEVALEALLRSLKSFALKHRTAEQRETLIDEMAPFQRGKTCFTCIKEQIEQAQPQWHGTYSLLVRISRTGLLAAAGDVVTIPADTWHWHGATRDTAMCHITIKRPGRSNWEVDEKNWASVY